MIGLGGTRRRGVLALASALSVCTVLASPAGATGPLGSLTQLPGAAGCVSNNGKDDSGGPCTSGVELSAADAPVISPDGKSLYVGAYGNAPTTKGGIAVFSRNPATGAITQLTGTAGCFTADGSSDTTGATCTAARGVDSPDGQPPAISSDGRFLYYASQGQGSGAVGSVAVFSRDTSTGALTQLAGTAGCFTTNGSSNAGAGTCGVAPSISGPVATVLSPDQKFLYLISYDNTAPYHTTFPGITVFSRDPTSGQLTLVPGTNGCLTYAGYSAAGAGTCQILHGFGSGSGQGFVISPDGRFAYAAEYNNGHGDVLIFSRDPASGVLTQLAGAQGCLSTDGSSAAGAGTCTVARSIDGAWELALSPDGAHLVVGAYDRGLAVFKRDATTGLLTELPGTGGCFSDDGSGSDGAGTCTAVNVAKQNYGLAFGPDGRTLTAVSYGDTFGGSTTVGGLSTYSFDPATGALTPLPGAAGCVTTTGASHNGPGTCGTARALKSGYGFAISPDGAFLYAASDKSNAINIFSRSVLPVCSNGSATTPFELPASPTLSCRDPNGDPFTYAIVTKPTHGTLSTPTAAGVVTYTPNPGFAGTDSFTFAATGTKGTSAAATFTLTVAAPTTAKIAFGKPKAKGSTITVPLSCLAHGATCGGRLTITAKLPVRVSKHRTKLKSSTVASRTFTVLSGRTGTVSLTLNAAARAQLTKQHKLALTITAVVTQPNRLRLSFGEKLTATLPRPKPKHRKHH